MVFAANLLVLALAQAEDVAGVVMDGSVPAVGATVISLVAEEPSRGHRPQWGPRLAGQTRCDADLAKAEAELVGRRNLTSRFAQTTTDSEGRFRIATASEGLVWVTFKGRSKQVLRSSSTTPTVVDLARTKISTERTVRDESGAPIAGAIVTLKLHHGPSVETVTGADGRFVLGPFDFEVRQAFIRSTGSLALHAFLDGGPNVVLLKPRSLVATIRDDRGPLAGAPVSLQHADCVVSAVTGADGKVRFEGLPPARYLLRAGTDLRGANRWVELGAEGEVRWVAPLVVRPTAGLEMHVAGAQDVWVQCGYADPVRLTQPARGVFVGGQLPEGDCRVEATSDDLLETKWVALKAGQTALESMKLVAQKQQWLKSLQELLLLNPTLNLGRRPPAIGPERIVAMHVLDGAGQPVPTARIERPWHGNQGALCSPNPHGNAVDADGHGWLELREGEVFQVTAPGFIPKQAHAATDGGVAEVRLESGPVTLKGTVRWRGKPVHGAMICVEGQTAQALFTTADGTFSIPGLPEGDYSFSALRGREWSVIPRLAVKARTRPLVIDLQRSK